MEIVGYALALLVGISLGVLGSGGSILTVPILVYLLHLSPIQATGYSLLVVGVTSAIGCTAYIHKHLVDFKTAIWFGLPSLLVVFFTRKFIIPSIPETLSITGSFSIPKDIVIMVLYAALMLLVAYNMIHDAELQESEAEEGHRPPFLTLIGIGILTGLVSGFLGVGGGFIFVPALVLLAKLPVRLSVGTSLFIITFNSFSGFTGEYMVNHAHINYQLLLIFSVLAGTGILIGYEVNTHVRPVFLRKVFGWLILVMGTGILFKELFW